MWGVERSPFRLKPKNEMGHEKGLGLACVSWKKLGHKKRIAGSPKYHRKNE